MARPTKLTPDLHRQIVEWVRAGTFETRAARACGIDPSTLQRWKARGRRESGIYRDFLHDLEQAAAQACVVADIRIYQSDPLAWSRLGPGRERPGEPGWSSTVRHEVSGPDGSAIPLQLIDSILKHADEGDASSGA